MNPTSIEMFYIIKIFLWISVSIRYIECACSLPTEWSGTWIDSYRGSITFNHNTAQVTSGWKVQSYSSSVTSFTCVTESSGYYLFKGDTFVKLFSNDYNAFLCLKYKKVTDYSYYYYLMADKEVNANNERAFVELYNAANPATVFPIATYCTPSTNPGAEEFHVLVKTGYESSIKQWFPTPLLGNFKYNYTFGTTTSCGTGSVWDDCTNRTEAVFNYTQCATKVLFSTSGRLYCAVSVSSGSTYFVSVLNSDTSVTNPTTYRFTCMAVTQSGKTVYVSTNPGECVAGQTSQVKTTNGGLAILDPYSFETDTAVASAGFNIIPIAAAAGGGLLLILALVLLACLLYKKHKKKKEEARIQSSDQLPEKKSSEHEMNGKIKEVTRASSYNQDIKSWVEPVNNVDVDTTTAYSLNMNSESDMIVEPMTARDALSIDLPEEDEYELVPLEYAPRPAPPMTPMSQAIRRQIPEIPTGLPSLPPITTTLRPKSVVQLDQIKL